MPAFIEKTVPAHEIMIDDWIELGGFMFRVTDTGHCLLDNNPVNHTLLVLTSMQEPEDQFAQVVIPMRARVTIKNQA